AGALAAVNDLNPVFVDSAGLVGWLESNEVAALTDTGEWPTPETAEIWQQFRADMLRSGSQKWSDSRWRRNVDPDKYRLDPIPRRPYRLEVNDQDHSVWICTPDFQRVVKLRRAMTDRRPSVLSARFEEGSAQAVIRRLGRSRAIWSPA